jgi:hypothetical protein
MEDEVQPTRLPVVGIMGTPGGILRSEFGPSVAMDHVGLNTGNLMFQYACSRHIQNPRVHFLLNGETDLDALREQIDVLVIPAANQLNPAWDMSPWASMIEKLDKPVVVAGLGAQARISEAHRVELQPGTVRFLDLLRERANAVGVRGRTTMAVLEKYRVPSGVVTGCPSNFINRDLGGVRIQEQLDNLRRHGARRVNFLYGTLEDYTRDVERVLFGLAGENGGRLIRQTDLRMLKWILDGVEPADVGSYLNWEARTVAPQLTVDEYKRKLRHRGKYYFDARAWIDDVALDDVSVGMRIHGAVAAIQGGSLGICVAFDSRTLELAETMGYPYVRADQAVLASSLRELGDMVEFTPQNFDRKRAELRRSLKIALEQFGVVTDL